MKALHLALALAAAAAAAVPAQAGTDVGISIGVAQPGFYGRIDIGAAPQPPVLVYPQPVVMVPALVARPPVYLYVPPGHAKHWRKHCGRYGACGHPVYFVRDDWYRRQYLPAYRHDRYRGHDGHGKHDD